MKLSHDLAIVVHKIVPRKNKLTNTHPFLSKTIKEKVCL